MALYKPDCQCNDCELPSGLATPSCSSTILWHERRVVLSLFTSLSWFPNSSPSSAAVTAWYTSLRTFGDSCTWLGVGSLLLTWNDNEYSSHRSTVERDFTVLYKWEHLLCVSAKGTRSHVILFIVYSFSCNSLDCKVWRNLQFAMKRLSQSKPVL